MDKPYTIYTPNTPNIVYQNIVNIQHQI